jgi:hypothetical protein
MKFGMKVMVLGAAILLTLVGFNLLVSSSTLEIINAGKLGGYEVVVTTDAQHGTVAHRIG